MFKSILKLFERNVRPHNLNYLFLPILVTTCYMVSQKKKKRNRNKEKKKKKKNVNVLT